MSEYFSILRVHKDSLICKYELSLFLLTLGWDYGNIVPDDEFLEMFLNQDDLFM